MKSKILFGLSLLLGLLMINAGLNKFFNYMPMPDDIPAEMLEVMTAMMSIGWLLPLVAVVEIVGGLLLIPSATRALGAVVLLPVVVGIVLTHIYQEPSGLPMALLVLAVIVWVIVENRHKYRPMLSA